MTLFPTWHRQTLEDDGYLVFEPGDEAEQALAMKLELAKSGRQVFLDTDVAGIADYLRGRHACVVLRHGEPRYTVETATAFLVNNGMHVFRASSVPVPRVGEWWQPVKTKARARLVRSIGAELMAYSPEPRADGSVDLKDMGVLISRCSWVRWVQKTRARCV